MDGQISIGEYLSTGFPAIIDAVDTIATVVDKAWALMVANPLLRVYVAGGLLSLGIGFFLSLRFASRRH